MPCSKQFLSWRSSPWQFISPHSGPWLSSELRQSKANLANGSSRSSRQTRSRYRKPHTSGSRRPHDSRRRRRYASQHDRARNAVSKGATCPESRPSYAHSLTSSEVFFFYQIPESLVAILTESIKKRSLTQLTKDSRMLSAIFVNDAAFSVYLVALSWALMYQLNFRHADQDPKTSSPFVSPEFRSQNDEVTTIEDRDIHTSSHG